MPRVGRQLPHPGTACSRFHATCVVVSITQLNICNAMRCVLTTAALHPTVCTVPCFLY